ncbi:MAG: NADPH-dependent FMN reductase [Mangrovibacterium sp.]
MNILIFNGSPERKSDSVAHQLVHYFQSGFKQRGISAKVFDLPDSGIPIFDTAMKEVPPEVVAMSNLFRQADVHMWLTPLYHGSMTGSMKNCLDWLEISSKDPVPYLTNRVVGLVCWGDGGQAMQGINAMDSVAKALRAWVLPYCIPVVRGWLFDKDTGDFSDEYRRKFDLMTQLLASVQVPRFSFR